MNCGKTDCKNCPISKDTTLTLELENRFRKKGKVDD